MAVTVVYSELAASDLQSIYNYISKDSVYYAKRELSLIRTAVKKLKNNVFLGRMFEDFNDELNRELIYRNYRIFYDISPDHKKVEIITIHHHSRLLTNNPAFTDED